MTIRWYPGHMGKAQEEMVETIRKIDVIIEVVDARLPAASSNYQLVEMRRNKPCVKVLNKCDLADPEVTKEWVRHFEQESGVRAIPMSAKLHADAKKLIKLCQSIVPHRGRPGWPLRIMIFGIPNTGKSTLINTLAGKSMAKVGDRPAVTTCGQRIDLKNGIVLTDTPGILWPDMNDQTVAYRLAASGAIGASALDYTSVAQFAAEHMLMRYPQLLKARYGIGDGLPQTAMEFLVAVGRRLGCLVSGGGVDENRAGEAFLRELRAGKLGRISFEQPETPIPHQSAIFVGSSSPPQRTDQYASGSQSSPP